MTIKTFFNSHLWFWIAFAAVEICTVELTTGITATAGNYMIHYLIVITLFYVQACWVVPHALGQLKFSFKLPLYLLVEFLVFCSVSFLMEWIGVTYFGLKMEFTFDFDKIFFIRKLCRFIYISFFSLTYFYAYRFFREYDRRNKAEVSLLLEQINRQKSEYEKLQLENSLLKAQSNPHFIFNTLNFIYKECWMTSPTAAEAILILSEIMRYGFKNSEGNGLVNFKEEIERINAYINLYRLKEKEGYFIEFVYPKEVINLKIIPMLLPTLTENMFKHALLSDPGNPGVIRIEIADGLLVISTMNLVGPEASDKHHTGLQNLEKRAHFAYGSQVAFNAYFSDNGRYFHTALRFILTPEGHMPPLLGYGIDNDITSAHESGRPL